ncbi:MAG: adenylate/guanylate cyclase domain-containing protein [Sandaracinaceae bacterium]
MRFPFRLKLLVLTVTFAALPLLSVGWLLIDVNEREVESTRQAMQIALAERVAARVEDELASTRSGLDAVARTLADATLSDDARLSLTMRLLEAERALSVVAIYDADGRLIDRVSAGETPRTPVRLDVDARTNAASSGRSMVGVTGVLVVPIVAAGSGVTGYVAGPVSWERTRDLVDHLSQGQLASDRGSVMVLDQARRALAHPRASAGSVVEDPCPGVDLGALPEAPESRESMRQGEAWVITVVGIRGAPWAVVAEVPRDVVYAPIDQMRAVVLGAIALALLFAVLGAVLFANRMTAPIRTLVEFTQQLASRRFDRRVKVDTSDELALLGDALSDAAEALETSEALIREEEAIRADLGRYLPQELVEQVIRREQSMELGGTRQTITVLFADVVAFTPLSERLPPEQTVALLNELFTLLTEAVFRHGGTVDKFVGDAVMALFGAPTAHPDHAARAVAAGQDMLRFLEAANAAWQEERGVEIQLAIGVHTGDAVVGNVGSETRMEYTAIGDVVNVAARLETIARPAQLLISRATRDAAELERAAPVGSREVPGRSEPVVLFEVPW